MPCTYCGAPNAEEEHRCHRCGRRLASPAQAAPRRTSPLPKMAVAPARVAPQPQAAPPRPGLPRQRPLFPSPIIRFEELVAGREGASRSAAAEVPAPARPATEARPAGKATRRRRASTNQPWLPFKDPPAPVEQAITPPRPEPSRYLERPVAGLVHRMLATFLDLAIITIAFAIVLTPFHLYGGHLVLTDTLTRLVLSSAAVALLLFYRLLGVFWEQDSPGMVWTGLRLVNFDGLRPTRKQRAYRLAGSLLSLAAAGFGFIWAVADQEKLTWHDHISKTFPSPRL
jgi:uncharacterized RDD family membrane protein YckC